MIRALCLLLAIGAIGVVAARPSPAPAPAAEQAAPPVVAQHRQSCSVITGCEADGCRECRQGFVFLSLARPRRAGDGSWGRQIRCPGVTSGRTTRQPPGLPRASTVPRPSCRAQFPGSRPRLFSMHCTCIPQPGIDLR